MNKKFTYEVRLKWKEGRKGMLSVPGKPEVEVATPPEFKGPSGVWSPEELFVGSINSCLMTTFLYYAEKKGLSFKSYESRARGILEKKGGYFMLSAVEVVPTVRVGSEEEAGKAKRIFELCEKDCFISNSAKSEIIIKPEIETG